MKEDNIAYSHERIDYHDRLDHSKATLMALPSIFMEIQGGEEKQPKMGIFGGQRRGCHMKTPMPLTT